MSDLARFDLGLSARTILIGCSQHSYSGLKAELGHAARVVLHES
jgi:hypothetical protein